MTLTVSKEEIKRFEKLAVISEKAPLVARIKALERKHGMEFLAFEHKATSGQEDFEAWDDYIEWKAYRNKLRDLDARMCEIDNASDIQIVG